MGYLSCSSLNSIFYWFIHQKLCKGTQYGDKQRMRAFVWNRQESHIDRKLIVAQDTSVEAQHYSSNTLPSPSPITSRLLVRSLHFFICLQIAFSLLLRLLESWGSSLFHLLLGRDHWYWSGPDTQQVHHHQHEPENDFSHNHTECNQSAHINSTFMFCGGEFYDWCLENSCLKEQKAALQPPGFIQAHPGGY